MRKIPIRETELRQRVWNTNTKRKQKYYRATTNRSGTNSGNTQRSRAPSPHCKIEQPSQRNNTHVNERPTPPPTY